MQHVQLQPNGVLALGAAFLTHKGEFCDYIGLCISVPMWEQTFLHMQQKEWSSETYMGALCLFHCQGLPLSLRDCEVDSGDAIREIRSKSRLFH